MVQQGKARHIHCFLSLRERKREEKGVRNKWAVQPNPFQRGTAGVQTQTVQHKPQLTSHRMGICHLYASSPQ